MSKHFLDTLEDNNTGRRALSTAPMLLMNVRELDTIDAPYESKVEYEITSTFSARYRASYGDPHGKAQAKEAAKCALMHAVYGPVYSGLARLTHAVISGDQEEALKLIMQIEAEIGK